MAKLKKGELKVAISDKSAKSIIILLSCFHGIFVTGVGEAAVRQELTLQRVRCQICIIVWHDGLILKVLTN